MSPSYQIHLTLDAFEIHVAGVAAAGVAAAGVVAAGVAVCVVAMLLGLKVWEAPASEVWARMAGKSQRMLAAAAWPEKCDSHRGDKLIMQCGRTCGSVTVWRQQ